MIQTVTQIRREGDARGVAKGAAKGRTQGRTTGRTHVKGVNQGMNQGMNRDADRGNSFCTKELRDSGGDSTWLSIAEAVNLLSVSRSYLHRVRRTGQIVSKKIYGNGGEAYLILLQSLPIDAQERYWRIELAKVAQAEPDLQIDVDHQAKVYQEAPAYNRRRADKYLQLLSQTEGMRKREIGEFLTRWNRENPEFKSSYESICRARTAYKRDGIVALLGQYGKTRDRSIVFEAQVQDALGIRQKALLEDAYATFKALYLTEGAPSAFECHTAAYGRWIQISGGCTTLLDGSAFPHYSTFERQLRRELPVDVIYLARYGEAAHNRKHGRFIDRDFTSINPGEVWVLDHHQLDVGVVAPDLRILGSFDEVRSARRLSSSRVVYPWFTAVQDMRTGRMIGWSLHTEAPNSDHVFEAVHHAASRFGLPAVMYLDNGKDFRSKDFAGGRPKVTRLEIDDRGKQSFVAALDIKVIWAKPYNAQAKLIERFFRMVKERYGKYAIGYRGGDVTERPERLEHEIKAGAIMQWSELVSSLESFIENVLNATPLQKSKHLQGLSPLQAWEEFYSDTGYAPRMVTTDALAIYCSRVSKGRRIQANGFYDAQLEQFYWGEWMFGEIGTKVYARRDPRAWQVAWFFDESTDQFLGKGELTALAPAIATTDVQRAHVRELIKQQAQHRKIKRALAHVEHKPSLDEIVGMQAAAAAATAPASSKRRGSNVTRKTWGDEVMQEHRRMQATGTHGHAPVSPTELHDAPVRLVQWEWQLPDEDDD